jgi:protein disulfide-isomerase
MILPVVMLMLALVAALPVDADDVVAPIELDHSNFQEKTSSGVWWIKFYSPYCHHCTTYKPHWNAAYSKLLAPHVGESHDESIDLPPPLLDTDVLNMGSVNCVTQGDLCHKMGIQAFPITILYNNGVELDKLLGVKKEPFLIKYISGQLDLISKTKKKLGDSRFPEYVLESPQVNTVYPGTALPSQSSQPQQEYQSVPLDAKTFADNVAATRDSWFVYFYSSQNAREAHDRLWPVWEQVAYKAFQLRQDSGDNILHIGHVNCDVEKQLCKEAARPGSTTHNPFSSGRTAMVPMLKFFASSLQTEYTGLRGLGDLLQFVDRALAARRPRELSYAEFLALAGESNNMPDYNTFVYVYDPKTTAIEDLQALEKLALALVGTVPVVKTADLRIASALGASHLPALYAVSRGLVTRYSGATSEALRDHSSLVAWSQAHLLSLVPQLTPQTADAIFQPQLVVLGILDPRDPVAAAAALAELHATARELQAILESEEREELVELRREKQVRIDLARDRGDEKGEEAANQIRVEISQRDPVGVAWVDGVFWDRWVKRRYGAGAADGSPQLNSRVVINDEVNGRYWDRTLGGSRLYASSYSILETLEAVLKPVPRIRAQALPRRGFPWPWLRGGYGDGPLEIPALNSVRVSETRSSSVAAWLAQLVMAHWVFSLVLAAAGSVAGWLYYQTRWRRARRGSYLPHHRSDAPWRSTRGGNVPGKLE